MMRHPEIQKFLADEHVATLRQDARPRWRPTPGVEDQSRIELRLCRVDDLEALADLAAMNGIALPDGSFVVAIVDGRLVAAQPIERGQLLADPFVRTAHLRRLLEVRAEQLRPATRWSFGLSRVARRATA
jgi:hypothetical protein